MYQFEYRLPPNNLALT